MVHEVEFAYGRYLKHGFEVFGDNVLSSIACALTAWVPFVGGLVIVNYIEGVKHYRAEQRSITVGALFRLDHAVDRMVVVFLVALAMTFMYVPAALIGFGICIVADRPGISCITALQEAFNFHKDHAVPSILLMIVLGVVQISGALACCLGFLVTVPLSYAMLYLAYVDVHPRIEAAQPVRS